MGRQLLSLRGYAESRKARGLPGGTLKAVQKAIETNRISTVADEKGRAKIDAEVADIQWMQNTDPDQSARANPMLAPALPGGSVDGQHAAGTQQASAASGSPAEAQRAYFEIKMRRERAEMQQAEMKAKQMAGELVEKAAVERAAYQAGRLLRDMLLSVPGSLAGEIAGMTDARAIEGRMRDELRSALDKTERLTQAALNGEC